MYVPIERQIACGRARCSNVFSEEDAMLKPHDVRRASVLVDQSDTDGYFRATVRPYGA